MVSAEEPSVQLAPADEAAPGSAEVGEVGATLAQEDSLQGLRFARADSTSIGGYGELHVGRELGQPLAEVDFHRFVLFVAHHFSDNARFYSELEVEHAISTVGYVALEQAYVDLDLSERVSLRSGMVLVPVGYINQYHEPPVFHGVERPSVDRVIVPSTWHEGGIGLVGQGGDRVGWELYAVGGLNAHGFSGSSGIRGGRQRVGEALSGRPALTGRVEIEPTLGLKLGLSGYAGQAVLESDTLEEVEFIATRVGSADVRFKRQGLELRAQGSVVDIPQAERITQVLLDEASASNPEATVTPVASRLVGAYGEVAYDVLHPLGKGHQVLPFVRYELYNTQASVEELDRARRNASLNRSDLVAGATWRPLPQVAFKVDVTQSSNEQGRGAGEDPTRTLHLGVGYLF